MSAEPSEPRLSATILLLRDAADFEVLMVERHYEIDFAAGALVFPGGKATDDDFQPGWASLCDGGFEDPKRATRVAAIREAYEETGILLARDAAARGEGAPLVNGARAETLGPFRAAVDRGEASFLELIKRHDLVLALDALVLFGHWITPVMMPKRFDTYFYLAAAPEAQTARQDGRETTDAVWTCPSKALAREKAGEATIIFPTRMNLAKLAETDSVEAALGRFSNEKIVTVLPQMSRTEEGKPCLLIPEEAGYVQSVELLENVKV